MKKIKYPKFNDWNYDEQMSYIESTVNRLIWLLNNNEVYSIRGELSYIRSIKCEQLMKAFELYKDVYTMRDCQLIEAGKLVILQAFRAFCIRVKRTL